MATKAELEAELAELRQQMDRSPTRERLMRIKDKRHRQIPNPMAPDIRHWIGSCATTGSHPRKSAA